MSILNLPSHVRGVEIETVVITPDMAAAWLERNTHNRTIRGYHVTNMAKDMAEGRWLQNGETIKFALDGTLLDGQHRLWAVIEADIPVTFAVATGLQNKAQETIDIGVARRLSDVLVMNGIGNANVAAAIATLVVRYHDWPAHVWGGMNAPTKTAVLEFVDTHHALLNAGSNYAQDIKMGLNIPSSAYGAVAILAIMANRQDEWDAFHEGVKTGANLAERDPRLTLRNYNQYKNLVRGTYGQQVSMAIVIKAFNAFMEGRRVALLRFGREEMPMPKVK